MSSRHLLYWRNAVAPSGAADACRYHSHSTRDAEVFERRRARLAQNKVRLLPPVQVAVPARPVSVAA